MTIGLVSVALLFFVAACLLVDEINSVRKSVAARRWRTCPGQLDKWNMRYESDSDETVFTVDELAYRYTVAGREYASTHIGYGFPRRMSAYHLGPALEIALAHAPSVAVRYLPSKPDESVLITGLQRYHILKLLTYLFLLLTLMTLWYTYA